MKALWVQLRFQIIGVFIGILVPVCAHADVLIVAPHPDDDVIAAAAVVQRALGRGEIVRVVYVTNGDYNGLSVAPIREGEAVNAQGALGVAENRLMFLGYPDGYLSTIRSGYPSTGSSYQTPNGVAATYATPRSGRDRLPSLSLRRRRA